jgi:hypothetical protein
MSSQMTIKVLVISIGLSALIVVTSNFIFSQGPSSSNDTQNKSAITNQTMMIPRGAMTFGSSLDNAKMHLMEAIMDIKEGNIKGAIMQLNMTNQGIEMHEKEMMDMKKSMKHDLSVYKSKIQNETS